MPATDVFPADLMVLLFYCLSRIRLTSIRFIQWIETHEKLRGPPHARWKEQRTEISEKVSLRRRGLLLTFVNMRMGWMVKPYNDAHHCTSIFQLFGNSEY